MADTDFSIWNPTAANQETDSTYQGDSQRSGGAVSGPFSPQLANKFFYQASIFIRSMCLMLVGKGYSPKDGTSPYTADTTSNAAASALSSVLSALMTPGDLVSSASVGGSSGGAVVFTSVVGGLTLLWKETSSLTAGTPNSVTFSGPFAVVPMVFIVPVQTSGTPLATSYYIVDPPTTSGFQIYYSGTNGAKFYYLAIGR